MSKKFKALIITILLASLALSFGAGCALGTGISPTASQGLNTIEQTWNFLFRDYVDKEKLDAATLSQAAINGMLEALDDPYTSYMNAETYELSLSSLEGKFEGIGAQVDMENDQIIIIAPIADSPAAKAGIKAGDTILGINGTSTSGMSIAEAVLLIRGPAGIPVTLLVLHTGETEPEEIEIIRAEIELASVKVEMMGDTAYIQITHFSERTNEELSTLMPDIEAATGIVLDLRSNPGGLLQAVIDVAGHFLHEGVVVKVVDNQGNQTSSAISPGGLVTDLPMVVLVDNYSASGSEVLAGALQDYDRAPIAGSTTFGKGSVNILHQLDNGSALYLTTARWLTPNGRLIEGKGLTPDYELEVEGDEAIQWAIEFLKSNK